MDNKIHKFAERFDKHFVKMGLREGAEPEEEKKGPEQPELKKRDSKAAEKKTEALAKAAKMNDEKAPVPTPELKKTPSKQSQAKAAAAGAKGAPTND